jgi:outer membrane protein assembly factor BamA
MGGYATQLIVASKTAGITIPIRFSLARPDAQDVRVTGSFNGWDSEGIRMTKDEEGTWSVLVPIAPGYVTYKFYIDGAWGPDPDVAEKVDDGQGGFATPFTVKAPKMGLQLKAGINVPEKAGTNFAPAFDYNRVDGLYLAFVLSNKTNVFPMPRFYLEGGHSWRRNRWLYSFELEQPLIAPFLFSVGGSFYDKTDSYDKEIISDGENVLVASFIKRDYRDYFDRRGVTGFAALRPFNHHMLKVSYTSDEYRPLETKAHAAIFRRHSEFPANPRNSYQICYNPENESVTCDMIALKSMGLIYEFDSRNSKSAPSTGIWARLGSEWAGRDFGGDLDFSRYTADLRFYNRITAKQTYAIRLAAGGMDIPEDAHCGCTPGPEYFFPKQFYVGGIGTLPGYSYKEFKGTHMLLMNIEYLYLLKGSSGVVFSVDAGDARGAGEDTKDVLDAMKLKFDAGVGFRIGDAGEDALTLGVAKRLDDSSRDLVVVVRASRPF